MANVLPSDHEQSQETHPDIVHPLTKLTYKWHNCRDEVQIHNEFQPVFFKGAVYTRGSSDNKDVIWKYSLSSYSWSPLPTPPGFESYQKYALTVYDDQLIWIGGKKKVPPHTLVTNSVVFSFDENSGWTEVENSSLSLPTKIGSYRYISATSHKNYLVVAWRESSKISIMIFDGKEWREIEDENGIFEDGYGDMDIVINNGTIYLLDHSDPWSLYSASIKSLDSISWQRLNCHIYQASNLTVFGEVLIVVTKTPPGILAFLPCSDKWIAVSEEFSYVSDIPRVVYFPNEKSLLLMGRIKTDESNRYPKFDVLEVSPEKDAYSPDANISVEAVVKLKECQKLQSFDKLTWKGDKLKEKAGFTMSKFQMPFANIYDTSDSLSKSIWSWTEDPKPSLPPTWKTFLQVLREPDMGLRDLADQIDEYLSSTSGTVIPSNKRISGLEALQELRSNLDFLCQTLCSASKVENYQSFKNQLTACRDQCHEAFVQLGEEQRTLTEQKDQDEPPFKRQKMEGEANLEEKPLALFPIKTKIKEEAVTVTKDKTTLAKPTAAWDLRGVEVCGEMTVVVHSSGAQQITWERFGLKLHIDEGSLPAGIHQCTLTIKASIAGQYEFPDNLYLVSAIFWLRCEPMCKFTKAVTVEMQHCARSANVNNLKVKFVRAICSQKQLPYTFQEVGGDFTGHSSYGVVDVNSFSGLAIAQEGSEEREYCSQLFYLRQPNSCQIHFVVTWNIDAHLTVVSEVYEKKVAILGLHQLVDFEADTITLDIPMKGISISGWTITPLIRPVVTKKQVDNFKEGKATPCCQLLAEVSARKEVPTMKHQVNLKGAKYPNNVFVICLPAEGSEYHDDTGQTPGATGPGSSRVLKPGSIKDPDPLLKELAQGIGGKYNEVGIDLGLMFKDLQNALETGPSMMLPANQKALQMLNLWRDKTPEMDFTYSILATALEKNGLQRLANKHCYMDHPDI